MAKAKHFVRPKAVRQSVHSPLLEDAPPLRGDLVEHAEHGAGRLGWYEWRGPNGEWVEPLQRVEGEGFWMAIVTTPEGGFQCPLDELTRT